MQPARHTEAVRLDTRAGGLRLVLGGAIAMLATLHLLGYAAERLAGDPISTVELIDMDREMSIPTFYAVLLAFTCSGVLALLSAHARRTSDRQWWRWGLLSAFFFVMALDDGAAVHERVNSFLEKRGGDGALWQRPWVYVGLAVVAALVVVVFDALRTLPRDLGRRVVLAGVVFLGGAVGMEVVGGLICESGDCRDWPFVVQVAVEESLELAGLSLFLLAFTELAGRRRVTLELASE